MESMVLSWASALVLMWSQTLPFMPSKPAPEGDEAPPVEWSCVEDQWESDPVVDNGVFKGSILSDCQLVPVLRAGYGNLQSHLMAQVEANSEVHAGPTEETYADMPSVYYDATFQQGAQKDSVRVRESIHIATAGVDQLLFDSLSTHIEGTGNARYLRKIDSLVRVTSVLPPEGQETPGHHVAIKNTVHAAKPWFAPVGKFKRELMKAIERENRNIQARVIPDLARNL